MSKMRTPFAFAMVATLLTGCKDDPLGVNSGDPMSEAEIQAFFYALSDAFASFGEGPAAVGPAKATGSYNESFNASAECPTSGSMSASVSVHATVTDEPFLLDATYQARVTPNLCVVPTESGGFTVDGGPYVQMNLDLSLTDTTIDFDGAYLGGIAFTSDDGRSGSCRLDVDFSGSASLETQSGNSSVSGTVCGVSVEALEAFSVE